MESKNILIFYSASNRSVQFNTMFRVYLKGKHRVYLLTTSPMGLLHKDALQLGVSQAIGLDYNIHTAKGKFLSMVKLVRFCYKYKINTVLSHSQPANLISVFAQYFTKTRFIIFRHHFNFSYYTRHPFGINANESLADKIINVLASRIIVPSTGVYKGMTGIEKVPAFKVRVIPYIYDFKDYPVPDEKAVQIIKRTFSAPLLLLMCSRMVPLKRHALVIEIMRQLVRENYEIKLLLVDEGPEQEHLKKLVASYNLENNVYFLGYRHDLINLMAAADLLVHPSLTEASNSTVKEMGLIQRTVIACKGVGDFDEYLNQKNSFLVEMESPEAEIIKILKTVYKNKSILSEKGYNLHQTIKTRFSANRQVVEQYLNNI